MKKISFPENSLQLLRKKRLLRKMKHDKNSKKRYIDF